MAGNKQRRKAGSRYSYLIRGYDQLGILRDTAGFYSSREQAEEARKESRELESEYEYSIEEFEFEEFEHNQVHRQQGSRRRKQNARKEGGE